MSSNSYVNYPKGVAFGPNGSMYFADFNNNTIRMIDETNGKILTVISIVAPIDVKVNKEGMPYFATSTIVYRGFNKSIYVGGGTTPLTAANIGVGILGTNVSISGIKSIYLDNSETLYIVCSSGIFYVDIYGILRARVFSVATSTDTTISSSAFGMAIYQNDIYV